MTQYSTVREANRVATIGGGRVDDDGCCGQNNQNKLKFVKIV